MKIQIGLRETPELKKVYKTVVILRLHKKRRKKDTTQNSQLDDFASESNCENNKILRFPKIMKF